MEEKKLEHPEERREEKQEKKKQYPVTRRDFYGCVIILLIAIFLQGMQTRALIRRGNTQLENSIANRISSVESRIGNIPNSIETALREADNPFRESSVEIAAADLKAKKVTLRMTVMPKEWKTGIPPCSSIFPATAAKRLPLMRRQVQTIALRRKRKFPFAKQRRLRQSCKEEIRSTPSIWAKRV